MKYIVEINGPIDLDEDILQWAIQHTLNKRASYEVKVEKFNGLSIDT